MCVCVCVCRDRDQNEMKTVLESCLNEMTMKKISTSKESISPHRGSGTGLFC